jgi:hypothetical protein
VFGELLGLFWGESVGVRVLGGMVQLVRAFVVEGVATSVPDYSRLI